MVLTQEILKSQYHYDPATGIFRYASPRPKIRVGEVAGTVRPKGGIRIRVCGKYYYASRLAWLYIHGRWPVDQIDHIDLDSCNNRISNLREATNGQNCANRRSFGAAKLKGVTFHKPSSLWHAQITKNKRCLSLGYFNTPEEAHAAYVQAAERLHGEYARAA